MLSRTWERVWKPLTDESIASRRPMVREDNMEAVEDCLRRQGASSVLGWGLVKFKEGSGLLGNPMVPLEPKDVRLLEHACAQQGRDEFSARQAMARARDGRDGRRPGERRDWQEVGDRRGKTRDRLEDEDARPGEGVFLKRVRPDFNGKCFGCGKEGHQVFCCPEKDRAGRRWVRASRGMRLELDGQHRHLCQR